MDVELQATCSALGYLEGSDYVKEPDCLETVKDLIRFLRRDNDVCDIRRQLGNAQILQNDLIPLVKTYHQEKELFDTVIKLLVNLTQPVLSCFNNEIPDEKTLRNNCLEVEGYLQDYKEAFIDEDLFGVLAVKIQTILKMDWDERREEDRLQLERLFVLVRNVLMVPPDQNREQRTEDDASIHDQVLWMMHTSGLEDLLLYVASSDRERSHLCMHVMEIIALIFKEQEPNTLASAGVQRSLTEKEKDQRELEQARERERAQKKANVLKYSARHSRFGGTFVLHNIKSISENDVIYHKPLCEVKRFSYDVGKNRKKVAKNRAPIKTDDPKRRSTLSMRLSLKEFCVQFLINAYNPLMRAVKDALTRNTAQDNDETYYLWAMRFFMEFCRLHCKRVDLISETMSMSAFHYIYTQLCTYYENLRLGKGEECKVWGRRSHLALKAYQELIRTLDFMSHFPDEQIKESAKVIQSNVFYMMEYRDVFVTLLKNFKESHCSRAYLRDLVESTHLFLKMLENFTKKNKNLVVQKKRKKKKQKKHNPQRVEESTAEPTEEELETIWTENISGLLSECFQGRSELPEDVTPFDAASEVDMDQQRVEAMLRIQSSLRDGQTAEALALFRAAREVWPERDEFGTTEMGAEEEFSALREIFMASLPRPQAEQSQVFGADDEGEADADNEVEEEEMGGMEMSETHFDFNGFINDFGHINVLKSYTILLQEFAENSDSVNHCVVKMLHRLTHDLGYVGMLFQASVFKSFNALVNGPYARLPRFKELSKFAAYVVRQFTTVAKINKKIFVDMLFWKTKSEGLAITGGYDFNSSSKTKVLWTEHQEEELQGLFEKFKDDFHPEKDTVDLILGELTSNHTRMQVLRELKRQGLINSAKDIKRKGGGGSGRSRTWAPEELQELRDAFELHKDSNYPIADIMTTLTSGRSKNSVIGKLLELGLVADKSDLGKKRKNGTKRRGRRAGSDDEEGERLFQPNHRGRRRNRSDSDDGSSSSSEDDVDSDGDSENDADAAVQNLVNQATCSVGEYVIRLVGQGYKEQISWIGRCLRNTSEDRDEGICIPTPIVPLTEENETAMEDESFLSFLRAIGITPPASQQELFWRIPAQFSSADLISIADGLTISEVGEAANADEVQHIVKRVFPELSSTGNKNKEGGERKGRKKEKKKKKKKTKSKTKVQRQVPVAADDSDGSDNDGDGSTFQALVPRGKHGSDTSDSGLDEELEAREQERLWNERKGNKKKVTTEDRKKALQNLMKRRQKKGDSDNEPQTEDPTGGNLDEMETVPPNETEMSNVLDKRAANVESDSDTSSLSPLSDEDDEIQNEEERKPQKRTSAKKRVLNLDSDSNLSPASDNETKEKKKAQKKTPSSSNSKKRNLESDSDGDTPLSSVRDEEKEQGVRQRPQEQLNISGSKKRILDSDSDSDVPLVSEASKRQKRSDDEIDLNLSSEDEANSLKAAKTGGSDKENKGSQDQLDESLRLHFSSSDEEEAPNKQKLEESKGDKSQPESFPATMLTQGLDSDDDEDDHITLKTVAKRRRAAIVDSDED